MRLYIFVMKLGVFYLVHTGTFTLPLPLSIHCSVFLGNIKEAFDKNPSLQNLLLDDFFKKEIQKCQDSWRKVVAQAVTLGIPTPAFSTALAFFDGYRLVHLELYTILVTI